MDLRDVCAVYILRERDGCGEVLLGYKRAGLRRLVGIGGAVEPGEDVRAAAVREVAEETGLVIDGELLEPVGALHFLFPTDPSLSQRSHVFVYRGPVGEPVVTDEISPVGFAVDDVPYERMWDDAARWLPTVLRGGTTNGGYVFGPDLATVVAAEGGAVFGP